MAKISVKIRPNSKRNEIISLDPLVFRIKAEPIDGKANLELVSYLAEQLNIAKSAISITHGTQIKQKILSIEGLDVVEITKRLSQARGQLLL